MELADLLGRDVTCHYDSLASMVKLECGRYYENEDEAEFFGDHIPEGLPAGIQFEDVTGYHSSIFDNLHLGNLKTASVEGNLCTLRFGDSIYAGMTEVRFSFARRVSLLSERKKNDA